MIKEAPAARSNRTFTKMAYSRHYPLPYAFCNPQQSEIKMFAQSPITAIVVLTGLLLPASSKALILECQGTTSNGEKLSAYMEWEGGFKAKFRGLVHEFFATDTGFDLYLNPHYTSKGILLGKTEAWVHIDRINGWFAEVTPAGTRFWSRPEDAGCLEARRRF